MKKDGPLNLSKTIFQFTCYGESDKPNKLLLRHGQVSRPVTEVCKKVMRLAYNNDAPIFEIENNTLVEYPVTKNLIHKLFYNWELLGSFFATHQLTPIWQNCHQSWGPFNKETGLWGGAVGQVSKICWGGL